MKDLSTDNKQYPLGILQNNTLSSVLIWIIFKTIKDKNIAHAIYFQWCGKHLQIP